MIPQTVKREIQSNSQSGSTRGVGLTISWPDGLQTTLTSDSLRRHCPCASCREKHGGITGTPSNLSQARSNRLRVIQATADESTDLQSVWAVGNYAIGLRFGDQHDSGIFSFEFLRGLCESSR